MSTPAPAGPGTPWDARYASQDYFYGTAPNDFLAAHAGMIDGPVLSLAEGEGRNAVFLARRGLQVRGVDSSAVGLTKAQRLAAEHGVANVERTSHFIVPEYLIGISNNSWEFCYQID